MDISFLVLYLVVAGAVFFGVFHNSKSYGSASDGFRFTMGVMAISTFVVFVIMAFPFPAGGIDGTVVTMLIASVVSGLAWLVAVLFQLNQSVKLARRTIAARRIGR